MKKRNRPQNAPQPTEAPVQNVVAPALPLALDAACCKEEKPRPSAQQLRTRLISAYAALDAVQFDLEGSYQHTRETLHAIEAQIGRLELRGPGLPGIY